MNHKQLIRLGKVWLRNYQKCKVILAERSNGAEIPDIIGWRSARHSILIECKTSRADFRADSKKWFRQDGFGMGQQRYFLAPKGIIPRDELPNGWGLIEIENNSIKTVVGCGLVFMDEQRCWAEMPLLVAAVRRLQIANSNLKKKLKAR